MPEAGVAPGEHPFFLGGETRNGGIEQVRIGRRARQKKIARGGSHQCRRGQYHCQTLLSAHKLFYFNYL